MTRMISAKIQILNNKRDILELDLQRWPPDISWLKIQNDITSSKDYYRSHYALRQHLLKVTGIMRQVLEICEELFLDSSRWPVNYSGMKLHNNHKYKHNSEYSNIFYSKSRPQNVIVLCIKNEFYTWSYESKARNLLT